MTIQTDQSQPELAKTISSPFELGRFVSQAYRPELRERLNNIKELTSELKKPLDADSRDLASDGLETALAYLNDDRTYLMADAAVVKQYLEQEHTVASGALSSSDPSIVAYSHAFDALIATLDPALNGEENISDLRLLSHALFDQLETAVIAKFRALEEKAYDDEDFTSLDAPDLRDANDDRAYESDSEMEVFEQEDVSGWPGKTGGNWT